MTIAEFGYWSSLSSEILLLLAKDGELLAANGPARQMDLRCAEIVGKNLNEIAASPPETVSDILLLASRSRQPLCFELKLHGKKTALSFRCDAMLAGPRSEGNGAVLIKLTPREKTSKPYMLVNETINELNRELKRRQELEEELRRNAALLAEADRRKDEFLATLAHEIRNPLSPISSGLESMKTLGQDPARVEQIRSMMERQTKQLVTLVDDLLDVSRITRGSLSLRKSRSKLREIVDTAVESSEPAIAHKNHRLSVDIPPDVELEADPHRLAQVLSNLLNNAAKYMPEGGAIELTADARGCDLMIAVRDYGIGIPTGMQERVFDMFTQADQCSADAPTGMGIGLALVKAVTELHGGSVSIESSGPGSGTTVRLNLPVVVQAAQKDASDALGSDTVAPGGSAQGSRRVLIVDDNRDGAELLGMMIEALGHEVRLAGDGEAALAAGSEFLPEIVLMDLGMPKMDGYEAARHMRSEPWGGERSSWPSPVGDRSKTGAGRCRLGSTCIWLSRRVRSGYDRSLITCRRVPLRETRQPQVVGCEVAV